MADGDFFVRIWGARGSLPACSGQASSFGCATPCVEVRCGNRTFVLDAGSGIFPLGQEMLAGDSRELDLLFTHCHYDHIEGLPFFRPLHSRDWTARIWSGHLGGRTTTAEMIAGYMREPYFPVGPDCFAADLAFNDFAAGDVIAAGDGVRIRTIGLNHPGGAVGYRFEYRGRSFCLITDTEHVPGVPDGAILSFIAGADVVIYDSAYSDEEFKAYVGFGHSTWQEGMRLCDAAGVDQFIAFHHQPEKTDAALEAVDAALRQARPNSRLARESMIIYPGRKMS
ncbi:MAG TPA: MBL fold metallo-hydrolase [Aestuariivirgaceae bacterium]|nr:MBL fold metallo-hydrolase [Aestuariivirgaceae bacterium]